LGEAIFEAVWFDKQLPKKRKNENFGLGSRKRQQSEGEDDDGRGDYAKGNGVMSLANLVSLLLGIEEKYSNCQREQNREWDTPEVRDYIISRIKKTQSEADFYSLMLRVETGMNDPWQVVVKKEGEEQIDEDESEVRND
jgi:hypothetical protein